MDLVMRIRGTGPDHLAVMVTGDLTVNLSLEFGANSWPRILAPEILEEINRQLQREYGQTGDLSAEKWEMVRRICSLPTIEGVSYRVQYWKAEAKGEAGREYYTRILRCKCPVLWDFARQVVSLALPHGVTDELIEETVQRWAPQVRDESPFFKLLECQAYRAFVDQGKSAPEWVDFCLHSILDGVPDHETFPELGNIGEAEEQAAWIRRYRSAGLLGSDVEDRQHQQKRLEILRGQHD